MPLITPHAIETEFDLGSKTGKLLCYQKYHTLKNLTSVGIFRDPLN